MESITDNLEQNPRDANGTWLPKTTSWSKLKQKLNNGHQASLAELEDLRSREQLTGWRAPETAARIIGL